MSYKQFDQKLFDDNDGVAKNVIKQFLEKHGYTVKEGSKYGIDLDVYKDGKFRYSVEVEVKHSWNGYNFPFSDINIPYRKKKFFEQHIRQLFIMLNDNLTSFIVIDNKTILNSSIVNRPNKYKPDGESFFVVPYKNIINHVKIK